MIDNSASSVVKRLIQHISKTGRNITTANWFTSYILAKDLLRNHKLTLLGTIRKNKREVPRDFVVANNREVYTSYFGFTKCATLVSY